MNQFLRNIFVDVVEQARDEMLNNCCNDITVKVTAENSASLRSICEEYAQDDDDELDSLLEQLSSGIIYFQDWRVLDILINHLKGNKL